MKAVRTMGYEWYLLHFDSGMHLAYHLLATYNDGLMYYLAYGHVLSLQGSSGVLRFGSDLFLSHHCPGHDVKRPKETDCGSAALRFWTEVSRPRILCSILGDFEFFDSGPLAFKAAAVGGTRRTHIASMCVRLHL